MPDRKKVIEWFEYNYLPRVGAYRNDCKQGCDACVPMHDGDDYCDIDMLCKILALLEEQEEDRERMITWLGKFCRHIDNKDKWLSDEENIAFFRKKMKQQFGWDFD